MTFLLADLEIISSTSACSVYRDAERKDCYRIGSFGLSKKKLRALCDLPCQLGLAHYNLNRLVWLPD